MSGLIEITATYFRRHNLMMLKRLRRIMAPGTRPTRLRSIVLVCALTLTVGGCSPFAPNQAERGLKAALDPYQSIATATVNFDRIVDGDWSYAVLVCSNTDAAQLVDALGFDPPLIPSEGTLHSMFVFVTGERVVSVFDSGDTTASKEPWVYPCTPPAIQQTQQLRPIVLPRSDSQVSFVFDPITFHSLWYIPEEEMQALQLRSER